MKLLGFDFDDWAYIKGMWDEYEKTPVDPSLESALKLRSWWTLHNRYVPSQSPIVCDWKPKLDYDFPAKLFVQHYR